MFLIPLLELFSDKSSEGISILIFTAVQGLKPIGAFHNQNRTGKQTLEGS